VMNWSQSSQKKKVNWPATVVGFILRDWKEGKMKRQNGNGNSK
jgi:hypothetical protein